MKNSLMVIDGNWACMNKPKDYQLEIQKPINQQS